MKKIFKILTVGLASMALLSGCGSNDNPDPKPDPTPTPEDIKVESVTLDKSELKLYLTKSAYLKATVTPSNAPQLLKWESENEDIALVSATGKVTGLGIGTTKIKVSSQSDSTKFAECTVTVEKEDTTVHVTDVTISKTKVDLYVGEKAAITAAVVPENATEQGLVWSSTNKNVAIYSDGEIIALDEGDAVIKVASKEKPEIYKECSVHATIKDTKIHVTSVDITNGDVELDLAGTKTFEPTVSVLPEDATDKSLRWTSSNPDKVHVDSVTGEIIAKEVTEEDVVITATSVDRPEKSDTFKVSVVDTTDPTVHVESFTIPSTLALDLKGGASKTISATITPSNAANKGVDYTVEGAEGVISIEKVGDNGLTVTPLKVGTVTIVGKSNEYPEMSHSCVVTVSDSAKHVTGVEIKNGDSAITALDIKEDAYAQVTANVLPLDADEQGIVWSLEEGAEDYVELLQPLTSVGQMIHAIQQTPKDVTVGIIATSVENPSISTTLRVSVSDPTIPVTEVVVKLNNVPVEAASVEFNKTISLTASVNDDATHKDIEWELISESASTYISYDDLEAKTINIIGKKVTEEGSPVVLRAKSKTQPSIYQDVSISVIDPTSTNLFIDFVDPVGYASYLTRTDRTKLNDVQGLPENASIAKGNYYKYAEGQEGKYSYKVGNQGTFRFAPSAYVQLAGDTDYTLIPNITTIKSLKKFDGESYQAVALNEYLEVAANGVDYTIKSKCLEGDLHSFKLELLPDITKYYIRDPEAYEFEFEVIEGYNVDTVEELTLFDNFQTEWNSFKEEHGLSGVKAEGGIVLHSDIDFDTSVVPSAFLYDEAFVNNFIAAHPGDFNNWAHDCFGNDVEAAKEAFINSPKDYQSILDRATVTDGGFTLEGNFFSINTKNLKKVALLMDLDGKEESLMKGLLGDGSHTQLFAVNERANRGPGFPTVASDVTMRNFSIVGNSGLDNNLASKGGIIAMKLDAAHFILENAIISKVFTSILTQDYSSSHALTSMDVDRLISYDSYSSMFYVFGTTNNHIRNSWLSTCGGPLAILDECIKQENVSLHKATMDCENCYLHNYVTGTEPWFQGHEGAYSLIDQFIIGAGTAGGWYHNTVTDCSIPNSRTIGKKYDDEYKVCDFIAISINAKSFATNILYNLTGGFSVNNGTNKTAAIDMTKVGKDYSVYPDGQVPLFPSAVAPFFFQTSDDSLGIFNGSQLLPAANPAALFTNEYTVGYLNPAVAGVDPEDPQAAEKQAAALKYGRFIGVLLGTFEM